MFIFTYTVTLISKTVYCVANSLSSTSDSPDDVMEHKETDGSWEILNKEPEYDEEDSKLQRMEIKDQGEDEYHSNYVCPSVNYDFLRDNRSYVVISNHVHGPQYYPELLDLEED
uniref:Uncharacterized protein n=1 Tax=Caenorhabditis japonica TaxID=281687 RepID=A0A8R1IZQ3_CAEJA